MERGVPLVQVLRSGFVESVHAGHAVIVDPDGSIAEVFGRPGDAMYPRSSNKPLQAAAMLAAGLDLHGEQLAVAAASHNGEPIHVAAVRAILGEGGLSEDDLANVPTYPLDQAAQVSWIQGGGGPSSVTQNCSGKHAAMLRTAQALGAATEGYLDPAHPVQRAIRGEVQRTTGEHVSAVGVDGCGAPVLAISLVGLARAFSRMVQAAPGSPTGRVAAAMAAHPQYVGGTGRDVTAFMTAVPGAIAKDGAEGVHVLALPDGRAAAVKIADGSERARPGAVVGLLRRMGVTDEAVLAAAGPGPVLGGGRPVGRVEAVF